MRYLFICLLFIAACAKKDTVKPTIVFSLPLKDTISVGADSLRYEFKVSDDEALSNFTYVIKDTSNNKFIQGGKFVTAKEYTLNYYTWFGGLSGLKQIKLTVQAYDKALNQTEATRTFYVKP
jgi:hypothetical protein